MKPPIFVYEPADLSVFESIAAAELGVEPIDVRNNEFLYYDAEGRILEASVVTDERGIERTLITGSDAFNKPGLKHALVEFFSALHYSRPELENMELFELVNESLKFTTE